MKEQIQLESIQINISSDTGAWNNACLVHVEKEPFQVDVPQAETPDRLYYSGYAANISSETKEWNGTCLAYGKKSA